MKEKEELKANAEEGPKPETDDSKKSVDAKKSTAKVDDKKPSDAKKSTAKVDDKKSVDDEKSSDAKESVGDKKSPDGYKKLTDRQSPQRFSDGEPPDLSLWEPKTKLGLMVKQEKITSMKEAIATGLPIKEIEIVDKFLPQLEEEIIHVGRVQRTTDSGRRMRFRVVAAVGNQDGFVGVAHAKGKEAGPTIRKSIARAKMNIKNVKRGCGSWQCGCGNPHTVPYKIRGKSGSVKVDLIPAPRGVGLVGGEIAKKILGLAGLTDVWVHTSGRTRTSLNFAYAVCNALENTNYIKLKQSDIKNLNIVSDLTKIPVIEDGTE